MEKLVLVAHLLIALAIIVLILMQRGKGAEAGASFGAGASQTIFGSAGSWNFFSKTTAILATLFFVTSLALAVMARNNAGVSSIDVPAIEIIENQQREDDSEIPSLDIDEGAADTEIPEVGDIPESPSVDGDEIPRQDSLPSGEDSLPSGEGDTQKGARE